VGPPVLKCLHALGSRPCNCWRLAALSFTVSAQHISTVSAHHDTHSTVLDSTVEYTPQYLYIISDLPPPPPVLCWRTSVLCSPLLPDLPPPPCAVLPRVQPSAALIKRLPSEWPKPEWHPPWKNYRVSKPCALPCALLNSCDKADKSPGAPLPPETQSPSAVAVLTLGCRAEGFKAEGFLLCSLALAGCWQVISGHMGWVRSVAFEPGNEWFCTGSADRTIKVRTVHIGTVQGGTWYW